MVSRELEKTRGILTTCDWGQGQSPKGLSQIYIFKNWSVMSKKKKKNWSIIFIVVTLLLSYISHHITHLLSYINFFWIYTTEVSLRPSLPFHVRMLKIFSILKKKKKKSFFFLSILYLTIIFPPIFFYSFYFFMFPLLST